MRKSAPYALLVRTITLLIVGWGFVLSPLSGASSTPEASAVQQLIKTPPPILAPGGVIQPDAYYLTRTQAPLDHFATISYDKSSPDARDHTLDFHSILVKMQGVPEAEFKTRTAIFAAVRTRLGPPRSPLPRELKDVTVNLLVLDYDGYLIPGLARRITWTPTGAQPGAQPIKSWKVLWSEKTTEATVLAQLQPFQRDRLYELSGFLHKERSDFPVEAKSLPSDYVAGAADFLVLSLALYPPAKATRVGLKAADYLFDREKWADLVNGGRLRTAEGISFSHPDLKDSKLAATLRAIGDARLQKLSSP